MANRKHVRLHFINHMAGRSPPHENRGSALPAILSVHVSLIIIIADTFFSRALVARVVVNHDVYFKFLFLRLGRLRAARRGDFGAFGDTSPPSFRVLLMASAASEILLAVFWAELEASLVEFWVSRFLQMSSSPIGMAERHLRFLLQFLRLGSRAARGVFGAFDDTTSVLDALMASAASEILLAVFDPGWRLRW